MRDAPCLPAKARRPRGPLRWALALSALIHLAGAAGFLSFFPPRGPDEEARGAVLIRVSPHLKGPTPGLLRDVGPHPQKALRTSGQNKIRPILHRAERGFPPQGGPNGPTLERAASSPSPSTPGIDPVLLSQTEKKEVDRQVVSPGLRLQRTRKDPAFAKDPPPSLILSAKPEGIEERTSASSTEGVHLPTGPLQKQERPLASPRLFMMSDLERFPTGLPTEEAGEPSRDVSPASGVVLGVKLEELSSLREGTGGGDGAGLRVLADYQVLPRYPLVARREGLEGTTLLRVQIKSDGGVAKVLILQSSGHPSLDEAAVEAVSLWRFRFEGEAPQGGVWASLPVRFVLSRP